MGRSYGTHQPNQLVCPLYVAIVIPTEEESHQVIYIMRFLLRRNDKPYFITPSEWIENWLYQNELPYSIASHSILPKI